MEEKKVPLQFRNKTIKSLRMIIFGVSRLVAKLFRSQTNTFGI